MFKPESWQSHAEYRTLFNNLKAKMDSAGRNELFEARGICPKLLSLNLDPVGEYVERYYARTGRPAMHQAQILRSFILFASLLNATSARLSLTKWVKEVLPGTWAFSYELQSEEEVGIEVDYEYVIFRDDNTVSITYPEGSLEGTYEAGSVAIRIDGSVDGGDQQQMLWRIITFSKKKITAEYKFDWHDQTVTAIVTLEKV